MTKKRCPDCKHQKGIGYDFWCGEGHTEYEVFGAETNCPYFEYHDWSKGTPSRTEKRFKTNEVGCIVDYYDHNLKNYDGQEIVDLLNEMAKENERLKSELQRIYDITTVNKVKNIVEEIYDDLLYETSEKSDYARAEILKCLEKIEKFGDDLE